jgi:carboxypeptidase Taq
MRKEDLEKLAEFKDYIRNIEYLESACEVLSWDLEVYIPDKGVPYRSEMLGYLSGELYKLQTSEKMKNYIDYFLKVDDLDITAYAMLMNAKKEYDETKKIPEKRFIEYSILTASAGPIWQKAKVSSDYNLFKPYLQKIIDFNKEFIGYWGFKACKYDTLLDLYEPGITVEKLDKVFGELKEAIVLLLEKIKASNVKINDEFFKKKFTKEEQKDFNEYVLKKMGFDFEAGRVDESEHPFTTEFCNSDVRITNHYHENEFRSALFSAIHEGGHAIYEQDIPDDLIGTMLAHGVSMGIHESQSRFYENIVGRSEEFWEYFYPEVQKRFPQFEGVSLEDFYKGINIVKPSQIRTEADELTYSIHVIIRYEIEKAFINGDVDIDKLPELWNEKYEEYLGVRPENDTTGILQDTHWSGGSIGYFPSYALGNLYGAQFLKSMERDIPDLYVRIANGNLEVIHEWLKEKIHKYGSIYKPVELIKMVTGEELTAKYFIEYLNRKYSKIYNLKI